MSEITINLDGIDPIEFFGTSNKNLQLLKKSFPRLKIVTRGNNIKINGSSNDIELFRDKVNMMVGFLQRYGNISENDLERLLLTNDSTTLDRPENKDVILYGNSGKHIRAKTPNQVKLVESSKKNDIVFAIGPAGTGKTYTAVALAVKALKDKVVRKIVLTRPAIEAGENLGFLPGDLKEKVDPYLRPLYDALDDMIPLDKLNYFMTNRVIEIAPLAFMRGRTLNDAFIILDEAQNATSPQLKMFLTRIGPTAKCIITGDLTQVDLPHRQESGLKKTLNILNKIEGIGQIYLDENDVIRHKLVRQIILAFEKADGGKKITKHKTEEQKKKEKDELDKLKGKGWDVKG